MTDLPDRDEVIDRWLRRATSVPGPGPNAACLDAEMMAAWADGGLSDAAVKAVRAHVADCSRCQVLAAVMTKLEPDAAGAADRRPGRSAARHPWLNWFVPLAAAAAAVAIWVFIPRQTPTLERAAEPGAQMAQAKPSDAAAAPVVPPAPLAESPRRAQASEPKLKAEGQPPGDAKQAGNEKDQTRQALARAEGTRERLPVAADPKKTDVRMAPATPPPAPMPVPPPPPAVAPPAAAGAVAQAAADRSANVGRAGTVAGGGGGARGGAAGRTALSAESRLSKEIVSTDDTTRWRISGGIVEKSTDAGRVWTPVKTGVTAEFTAGASPSPTTCWIVGLGGVVLLTTDGQKWERLKFPDTTDLSSVRATDARTATVTTADGREFSTIDGGTTWVRR